MSLNIFYSAVVHWVCSGIEEELSSFYFAVVDLTKNDLIFSSRGPLVNMGRNSQASERGPKQGKWKVEICTTAGDYIEWTKRIFSECSSPVERYWI